MIRKTESSEAPTNFTEKQSRGTSSSYLVNKKRQMFSTLNQTNSHNVNIKHIIEQNGYKLIPKNVLIMNPVHAKSVTCSEIFMPNQDFYVSLRGNFYCVRDSRSNQKFINRNSMPNSETVSFNVQKEDEKLVISSVQRFTKQQNNSNQLWYRIDVVILNVETEATQRFSSVQKGFNNASFLKSTTVAAQKNIESYNLQFKGIQLVKGFKWAFVIFEQVGIQKTSYEIILVDLMKANREGSLISSNLNLSRKRTNVFRIESKIYGRGILERKDKQKYLKMINSEYGDILLIVTSQSIYEIQLGDEARQNQQILNFKQLWKHNFFAQNKNGRNSNCQNHMLMTKKFMTIQQKIIDAQYLNGLKIIILSNHGRIFVVESNQCTLSESLYGLIDTKDMTENYIIENFFFRKIYLMRGLLVVEVEGDKNQNSNLLKSVSYQDSILEKLDENKDMMENVSRALIVFNVKNNSLSLNKFISLPFQIKDYEHVKIHPFKETDEILIQVIRNKNLQILELYRIQIISSKNSFIPFGSQHILKQLKIILNSGVDSKLYRQVDCRGSSKVSFCKTQKVFYVLKGNQVSGYHIHSNEFISDPEKTTRKILSLTFFQKPLKIVTNPMTGQVIILFKQFVKFFNSIYSDLKLFYQLNTPFIKDVVFSQYGDKFMLAMNDNTIQLVDSYRFTQKKVMNFYGDIREFYYPNQYILCVRSIKNVLNVFKKKPKHLIGQHLKSLDEMQEIYEKIYEVKIENDDLYFVDDSNTIILKKLGYVQFYSHIPESRLSKNMRQDNAKLRFQILSKENEHFVNRKNLALEKNDYPTFLYFSSQFSTLFVGTYFGNIRQYLYPFLPVEDVTLPQFYNYAVSNNAIVYLQISADFSQLYVLTQKGQILELRFDQFLNGDKKNGIYVISKNQNSQNTIKYEFSNRSYLIEYYTPINDDLKQAINQKYEEIIFVDDKIKNDIEDIVNKIKIQSFKEINQLSTEKKQVQAELKQEFQGLSSRLKGQKQAINGKLKELNLKSESSKQDLNEKYQREIMEIYRENDRLNGIINQMMSQFEREKKMIKQELEIVQQQQHQKMQLQTERLQNSYKQLLQKYSDYSCVTLAELEDNQGDLEKLKRISISTVEMKLHEEQQKKQSKLSALGKLEKQIQRYKKRSIYFENLIMETRNQIDELSTDVDTYNEKKQILLKELNEKELLIEEKQTQIVQFIKKNNQIQKVKNVSQYQLDQFQSQIYPIQSKIAELERQVHKMNDQVMIQFNGKLQQNSLTETTAKRIQKLKNKNHGLIESLLNSKNRFKRFIESVEIVLARDPFALNIKEKLQNVIDQYSKKNETFFSNEQLQKAKKLGQKLLKKKNMILKQIQREERKQEGVIKNKNQFSRYYSDNTNLVKKYNQLFKDNKMLLHDKAVLEQKINAFKLELLKTPRKRTSSLNIRKVSDKKLTPFQRYEQEQIQLTTLKLNQRDTTETRLSKGKSSTFLKSLIKDTINLDNNLQKMNIIRDKIRTFVNPQLQRQKDIQKQLFRQKIKSNFMPNSKI